MEEGALRSGDDRGEGTDGKKDEAGVEKVRKMRATKAMTVIS